MADADGFIIEANSKVMDVYGRSKPDLIGKHPLTFCPKKDYWDRLSQQIFEVVSADGYWEGAVMNIDRRGSEFPIFLRVKRITFRDKHYVVSWAKPYPAGTPFNLTPRQGECIWCLGRGMSRKQISAESGISESSVQTHLNRVWKSIFPKVGDCSSPSPDLKALQVVAVRWVEAGWSPNVVLQGVGARAARPQRRS